MGSIAKIHEMLVSKQVSCTELTKSYLEEIEKSNGELNAYVNVTPDTALETAKTVDEKIAKGEEIGMLEGVPMTLKDNLSTKDIETTCCSKILKGYKPIYNATVWENLSAQNAVMLGKTNMDEFAMGSSCETSCFGGAMNPFNTKYVSGGSSGGVASAVGANIAWHPRPRARAQAGFPSLCDADAQTSGRLLAPGHRRDGRGLSRVVDAAGRQARAGGLDRRG